MSKTSKDIWHPRTGLGVGLRGFLAIMGLLGAAFAQGFDGFMVTELPKGGDVTVPGEVRIKVPSRTAVMFSSSERPQTITLSGGARQSAQVTILGATDKRPRVIKMAPGASAVYGFKNNKPIKMLVESGEIEVTSLWPLKIQR